MSFINVSKELFYKINCTKFKPEIIQNNYKVPKVLRKSLKLRCIDVGDNEALLAELYSLEGPKFSLESYNISFTASPKHADGIFIVGAVTKNMKEALLEAYNVVPDPKVVIACGDKAINGDSRFGEIVGGVKSILPQINLEIPGNPDSKNIFNYLVNFVK